MLADKADIWLSQDQAGKIVAGVVTNYIVDYYTKVQYLQILAMIAYRDIPMESYMAGLDLLKQYAVSKRCRKMVMYTTNTRLLSVLKHYGADTDWRFVEIPTQGE